MQVRHGLSGGSAGVGYNAETVLESLALSYLGDDLKALGYYGAVTGVYAGGTVSHMLLGYHEYMGRGLGIDVPEREDVAVLVDFSGGDLTRGYFAEQAVRLLCFLLIPC